VGKKVVTSGLGGIFPKGIMIGEITEVRVGEDGLTQMAYIKPSADLFRLNEVFVLDRLDETERAGEGTP
jgi:rod shape-determining protein MreC